MGIVPKRWPRTMSRMPATKTATMAPSLYHRPSWAAKLQERLSILDNIQKQFSILLGKVA